MIYSYQITASKRGHHMTKAAKGIPDADRLSPFQAAEYGNGDTGLAWRKEGNREWMVFCLYL